MKISVEGNQFIRRCCIFIFVIFMFSPIESNAASGGGDWTGNTNLFLGLKALNDGDWEPLEDQPEIGIEVDFKQQGWPVSIAIDFLNSADSDRADSNNVPGFAIEGQTTEINIGVRKIWDQFPGARPFFGLGLSFINADLEDSLSGVKVVDEDTGVGVWFGTGVYWTLAEWVNLGFQVKYSNVEVTLLGTDRQAGGIHYGTLVGAHW